MIIYKCKITGKYDCEDILWQFFAFISCTFDTNWRRKFDGKFRCFDNHQFFLFLFGWANEFDAVLNMNIAANVDAAIDSCAYVSLCVCECVWVFHSKLIHDFAIHLCGVFLKKIDSCIHWPSFPLELTQLHTFAFGPTFAKLQWTSHTHTHTHTPHTCTNVHKWLIRHFVQRNWHGKNSTISTCFRFHIYLLLESTDFRDFSIDVHSSVMSNSFQYGRRPTPRMHIAWLTYMEKEREIWRYYGQNVELIMIRLTRGA